jgi:hypothetical protein
MPKPIHGYSFIHLDLLPMAAFYFFTDPDLLNAQPASGAFGPVTPTATHHRYRTCSLHSATGEPKAYAVCSGVVIVQQDSNPQLAEGDGQGCHFMITIPALQIFYVPVAWD